MTQLLKQGVLGKVVTKWLGQQLAPVTLPNTVTTCPCDIALYSNNLPQLFCYFLKVYVQGEIKEQAMKMVGLYFDKFK